MLFAFRYQGNLPIYFLPFFSPAFLGSLKKDLSLRSSLTNWSWAVPSFSTFALKILPLFFFAASWIQAGAFLGTVTSSRFPRK